MVNYFHTITGEPMSDAKTKTETTNYAKANPKILTTESGLQAGRIHEGNLTYLTNDDVILVPKLGVLNSRLEAEIDSFIYTSPMDTVTGERLTDSVVEYGHTAVVCRFLQEEWRACLKKYHRHDRVFFAVGSKDKNTKDFLQNLEDIIPEDVFPAISVNIDVAHGDTVAMHNLYKWYASKKFIRNIMSGSISTPAAAIRCIRSGCTHLRIGIGPGSACSTRLQTGCGVPQLSAVVAIHDALTQAGMRNKVILIADGGVRHPGDAVKYIAAGANGVMLGKRFSECPESPGWKLIKDKWWQKPKLKKRYRGQASAAFQVDMFGKRNSCPEGETGPLITTGLTVQEVIGEFEGGLRSALSYLGLRSIKDLRPENVSFLRITPSAAVEGEPHGTK